MSENRSGGEGGEPGESTKKIVSINPKDNSPIEEEIKYEKGIQGRSGLNGKTGSVGGNGTSGFNGHKGVDGSSGTILYRILDPQTRLVKEQSPIKYKIYMSDFKIIPVVDDGIIEPGEEILIKSFKIRNSGGLTAPPGAVFQVNNGENFTSNGMVYLLGQALAPDEEITVKDFEFKGKIAERARTQVMNYGSYRDTASFTTCTKYFDRVHHYGKEGSMFIDRKSVV